MNTAEWILVAILSITLFIFLVVGIILIIILIRLTSEAKRVVIKSQDIAENANGIVSNIKGMTSIGGTVEMFVDKYINPKLKKSTKNSTKETSSTKKTEEKEK